MSPPAIGPTCKAFTLHGLFSTSARRGQGRIDPAPAANPDAGAPCARDDPDRQKARTSVLGRGLGPMLGLARAGRRTPDVGLRGRAAAPDSLAAPRAPSPRSRV